MRSLAQRLLPGVGTAAFAVLLAACPATKDPTGPNGQASPTPTPFGGIPTATPLPTATFTP